MLHEQHVEVCLRYVMILYGAMPLVIIDGPYGILLPPCKASRKLANKLEHLSKALEASYEHNAEASIIFGRILRSV